MYRNSERKTDFEIVELKHFFSSRPASLLEKDARLDFWVMIFITGGEGFHNVDFIRRTYRTGDVIFIQKNQVQHFEVNSSAEGYIIHLNEPFFYRIKGFDGDIFLEFTDRSFGTPVLNYDLSKGSTKRKLLDLLHAEYENEDTFNIELIASLFQGLILSMHAGLPEEDRVFQSKDYEHFKAYRRLVEENYSSVRSVENYAGMMNVSTKTVNQAVRRVAGMSAKQLIIDRIILEIKRYLSQGELLNYEIADTLGFDEAANMTSFFTRHVGLSPKEFRNSN